MARRRRKRSDNIFILCVILAFIFTSPISVVVGSSGGGFDVKSFLITFFIILAVLAAISIILSLPVVKGAIGEKRVSHVLKKLSKKYGGHFINNIIVPGDDGKTSQIDHVYISKYGIYVIETKNYAGRIYGGSGDQKWTQVLAYGNVKHKLYNPVKQNQTHIYRLREAINENVPYYSVIVLTQGNTKYVNANEVYNLRELRHLIDKDDDVLIQEEQVESVYIKIKDYKDNPVATNREHVKAIKQMQKDIDNNVCPRCGGKLVLKTSSKDGSKFFGCSNYPHCRFIKKQ